MGPIWCRQDPGGPHVGPMSFAIWEGLGTFFINRTSIFKQLFKFSGRCLMYFMWLKKLDTFVHKSINVIRQPSVNQWRAGRHQNATYVVIQAEPWWRASIWRRHRKVVIKQCSYHNNIIDIQNRLPYSKVVYPAIIVLFSCLMEVNHGVRTGPDYPFR